MELWRTALAGALGVVLAGCAYVEPVSAWTDGVVAVQANFTPARALAAVPVGTRRIAVRVTGVGVPEDAVLAATLTPEHSRAVFTDVPAGLKQVVAKAYDGEGQVLAVGQAALTIVPGAIVAARLRLELTGDGGQFALVLQ